MLKKLLHKKILNRETELQKAWDYGQEKNFWLLRKRDEIISELKDIDKEISTHEKYMGKIWKRAEEQNCTDIL